MNTEEPEHEQDPCLECLLQSDDLKQCPECEHKINFLQIEAV